MTDLEQRHLPAENGGRLLVIGALNVDMVVAVPRLPAAGETVVGEDLHRHGGGKGGNSAVAAVRSGAEVRYVGAVGDDELGAAALAELRAEGIDVADVVVTQGSATGVALIVVDSSGENQIAVAPGANAAVTAQDVNAAMERASGWARCVLISTEISASAVAVALEESTARGWLCVLNPAPVQPTVLKLLARAPIITPNQGELRDIFRLLGHPRTSPVEVMATAVASHTRAPVVVTLGAEGLLLCTADGVTTHIPAGSTRRVVDTTGAGDTFNGVFAASLAAGNDLESAARSGVDAAAMSVEFAGARGSMPSAQSSDRYASLVREEAGNS